MIQRMSHFAIYVLDQERALGFYRDKLGFEVRADSRVGPFRWLTVGPKSQPDVEIILMQVGPGPLIDAPTADALRVLVGKGALCAGVLETTDVHRTYEELKSRGVEFGGPPEERHYGIECIMKEDSGNWFSVTQRKR